MKELDINEKAMLGQAINLAVNTTPNGTREEILKLVFDKYLPLIECVRKEYLTRRTAMQDFIRQREQTEQQNELLGLLK